MARGDIHQCEWRDAIVTRHNGYNPEMRRVMPDLKRPSSPTKALDELIEEAERLGESAASDFSGDDLAIARAMMADKHQYHAYDLDAALGALGDVRRAVRALRQKGKRRKSATYAND